MNNLLLIEPDYMLAQTYQQTLEADGAHRVAVASNAQSAIMAADKVKPDLVILELQLVEHSGIEFLYEFRSYPEWQPIPVVVHTVVEPTEFANNWELLKHELGVQLYLYKPQTSLHQLTSSVSEISNAVRP